METMQVVTYQGPAVLIPRDDDHEYAVGVRISQSRNVEYDPDTNIKLYDVRSWRADIDGHMPTPPSGECVLRLPDGHEGKAVVADIRGTSERPTIWEGKLTGSGPAPNAE